jgi:hypothetical protein
MVLLVFGQPSEELRWRVQWRRAADHDDRAKNQARRLGKGSCRTSRSLSRHDGVELVRGSYGRSGSSSNTSSTASRWAWLKAGEALGEAELLLEQSSGGS